MQLVTKLVTTLLTKLVFRASVNSLLTTFGVRFGWLVTEQVTQFVSNGITSPNVALLLTRTSVVVSAFLLPNVATLKMNDNVTTKLFVMITGSTNDMLASRRPQMLDPLRPVGFPVLAVVALRPFLVKVPPSAVLDRPKVTLAL